MSSLNELIGYVDFMDCRKIWPKHSEDNGEQNGVGKLWYFKYSSHGDQLRNTSRVFSATQTLEVDI